LPDFSCAAGHLLLPEPDSSPRRRRRGRTWPRPAPPVTGHLSDEVRPWHRCLPPYL